MPRMTIAIPDEIHERLRVYQRDRKPHLSMRAVIVEALDNALAEAQQFDAGRTQLDLDALRNPELLERIR